MPELDIQKAAKDLMAVKAHTKKGSEQQLNSLCGEEELLKNQRREETVAFTESCLGTLLDPEVAGLIFRQYPAGAYERDVPEWITGVEEGKFIQMSYQFLDRDSKSNEPLNVRKIYLAQFVQQLPKIVLWRSRSQSENGAEELSKEQIDKKKEDFLLELKNDYPIPEEFEDWKIFYSPRFGNDSIQSRNFRVDDLDAFRQLYPQDVLRANIFKEVTNGIIKVCGWTTESLDHSLKRTAESNEREIKFIKTLQQANELIQEAWKTD